MDGKKFNKRPVIVSLVWGALMIAVALVNKGSENSNAILMLMIAGWIATGSLSNDFYKRECRMFRRMIGKAPKSEG